VSASLEIRRTPLTCVPCRDLLRTIHNWLYDFVPQTTFGFKKNMKSAETLLQISIFVANRALLTYYSPQENRDNSAGFQGREIQSSPGRMVQKPVVSTAALIVLSILIGLQVIGLSYLAYYIYHVPTWTHALDAMAMARIVSAVPYHIRRNHKLTLHTNSGSKSRPTRHTATHRPGDSKRYGRPEECRRSHWYSAWAGRTARLACQIFSQRD
jgi:hypothetical protein